MGDTKLRNDVSLISAAITGVVLNHPFFASILLRLRIEEDQSIETMATDGKGLFYSTEFVKSIRPVERVGVLCHEIMHIALAHHIRRMGRMPERWNYACDYAINPILIKSGIKLPKGAYVNKAYEGMGAEEIYELLKGTEETRPRDGSGAFGEVRDMPGIGESTEAGISRAEATVATMVTQAAMLAKKRGRLPGAIEEAIAKMYKPKVDWASVLRSFLDRTAKNDYSFKSPNRRYVYSGAYAPSVISNELGRVILAIDTSGSITQDIASQFFSEVRGVLDAYDCEVTVVQCDAQIRSVKELTRFDDDPGDTIIGRGGTDFSPVFEFAKIGEPVKVIVYLTDGWGNFPRETPETPAIWVSTERTDFPFGEVIKID